MHNNHSCNCDTQQYLFCSLFPLPIFKFAGISQNINELLNIYFSYAETFLFEIMIMLVGKESHFFHEIHGLIFCSYYSNLRDFESSTNTY
jgi:hypothetical protein